MWKMKRHIVLAAAVLLSAANLCAQRYKEAVFSGVDISYAIPFSSAKCEGATENTELLFDIYTPHGDTATARPVVITVFGGGFIAGSRDFSDMKAFCKKFAQHGYVAVSIDYRLLPLAQLSRKSFIREAYLATQDVSSIVRFLKLHHEDYGIDTNNIFLLGNSAGSIALLHEIFLNEDERPDETHENPDLGPVHSSGFEDCLNISPKVRAAVAQWGGVMDLQVIDADDYVPICFIHGTNDDVVPIDSGYCYSSLTSYLMPFLYGSRSIVSRLEELGITNYEFHPFEGEKHAFYMNAIYFLIDEKFQQCFTIAKDFFYKKLSFNTAVVEHEWHKINVYPNPTDNELYLELADNDPDEPLAVEIFNAEGQTISATTIQMQKTRIDVSGLPAGIYFVKIDVPERPIVKKIVIFR